ncbi:sterol O-acyltransferase 1-like [Episyrphus balteatus]|uniref:sterol O-acyltransferase 1-like n=1 Tax=Episyrphus balteatus TaxID=286459 RepID=UPI0024865DBC|nr:sterol O-acyltransferase 1-like [Episyrphus balteatus]
MPRSRISKIKCHPKKKFFVRDSIHTVLMSNYQYKSIYNMCIAIFFILLLDNISQEFLKSKTITLGLQTIVRGFGLLHVVFIVWVLLHVPIIGLYFALRGWYNGVQMLKSSSALKIVWNICCLLCFTGLQFSLIYVSTRVCLVYRLPFGSAFALLIETFRLMMKCHAFVRTNVRRLIVNNQFTSISSYLYYLFAPTFIYQDAYPRTEKIRWKIAFKSLLEIIAIIFLVSFLYEGYIQPNFQAIGFQNFTLEKIAGRFFGIILPSNLIFFGTNYLVLHSWLNFAGEVMRFGDRLYYEEWWTSGDFKTYYRSWNITVHEWFYEFIYKDSCKYIFKGSQAGSALLVFWLSTFMHEYVIVFSMRMFFPLLSILYGVFGVCLYFTTSHLPPRIGNIIVWLFLLLGSAVLISFYSMAYYSQFNSF